MSKSFEEICFDIYKSITPKMAKMVIPFVDMVRKIHEKPPIPLREKLCEMKFPEFEKKVIMLHGVSVGEVLSLENLRNIFLTINLLIDIILKFMYNLRIMFLAGAVWLLLILNFIFLRRGSGAKPRTSQLSFLL